MFNVRTVFNVALCAAVICRVFDNVVCQKQLTHLLGQGLLRGQKKDKIVSAVITLALVIRLR